MASMAKAQTFAYMLGRGIFYKALVARSSEHCFCIVGTVVHGASHIPGTLPRILTSHRCRVQEGIIVPTTNDDELLSILMNHETQVTQTMVHKLSENTGNARRVRG